VRWGEFGANNKQLKKQQPCNGTTHLSNFVVAAFDVFCRANHRVSQFVDVGVLGTRRTLHNPVAKEPLLASVRLG